MPGGPFLGRSNLLTRGAATTTRWHSKAASQLGLYPAKGGGGRAAAMGPTGSRPSIDPTLHKRAHDRSPLQSSGLMDTVGYLWALQFQKIKKIHVGKMFNDSVRNQQKKYRNLCAYWLLIGYRGLIPKILNLLN